MFVASSDLQSELVLVIVAFTNALESWLGDGGGLQILHKRRMQIYRHYRRIIGWQVIGNEFVLLDCSIFFLQINLAFVHFVAIFATSGKRGANHRRLTFHKGVCILRYAHPLYFYDIVLVAAAQAKCK